MSDNSITKTQEIFKSKRYVAFIPSKALSKSEDELLHGTIIKLRDEFWDYEKNCVPKRASYKFSFRAIELQKLIGMNRSKFAVEVEASMKNISSQGMFLQTEKSTIAIPIFKFLKFDKASGELKVEFNEYFIDDVINVHGQAFTKISLAQLRSFNSKYSRAIYDLVKSSASTEGEINVKFEVKFIRELLALGKTYKLFNNFSERVLKPVLKDLESSDLNIKMTYVTKPGSRKIEALKFTGRITGSK